MATIIDKQTELITLIKSNPLLWNDDPTERAKPEYVGFRLIRDNFVSTDWKKEYFPALVVDIVATGLEGLNVGYHQERCNFDFTTMQLYDKADVSTARKNALEMLYLCLDMFEFAPQSPVEHYEGIVKSFEVSASAVTVEVY